MWQNSLGSLSPPRVRSRNSTRFGRVAAMAVMSSHPQPWRIFATLRCSFSVPIPYTQERKIYPHLWFFSSFSIVLLNICMLARAGLLTGLLSLVLNRAGIVSLLNNSSSPQPLPLCIPSPVTGSFIVTRLGQNIWTFWMELGMND